MTALIIIGGIVFVLLILLLLPFNLKLSFSEKFDYQLTYAGIKIFPKKENTNKEFKTDSQLENDNKSDNFIKNLYEENSFPDFLKIVLEIVKILFSQLKYLLKHIKIRRLSANIVVAAEDAAVCGISYGIVCSVFYTFLEFLENNINVKFKKVDISADFEAKKPSFTFSMVIKISPLFSLVAAAAIARKYIEITNKKGSALNERK